MRGILS